MNEQFVSHRILAILSRRSLIGRGGMVDPSYYKSQFTDLLFLVTQMKDEVIRHPVVNEKWVKNEMYGYSKLKDVPNYRIIGGVRMSVGIIEMESRLRGITYYGAPIRIRESLDREPVVVKLSSIKGILETVESYIIDYTSMLADHLGPKINLKFEIPQGMEKLYQRE